MKTATAEAIDVTPEPTQALTIHQPQTASLFRTDDPVEVVQKASAVASALRDVISKQGLISNIHGKQYPKCEAWTLCGTMLGIFPVLCWTRPLEEGWEARVEAKTRDGAVVGAAEAECLRSERNWSNRDDFALRSMAQTRATAKALRMPLGFIMTLAGYEPTPSEEMTFDKAHSHDDGDLGPQKNLGASGGSGSAGHPRSQKQGSSDTAPANVSDRAKVAGDRSTRTENINPPPTQHQKDKMLAELIAHFGDQKALKDFAVKAAILLPTEALLDWPLRFVPNTQKQMDLMKAAIEDFLEGREAARPFVNSEPLSKPQTAPKPEAKKTEVPRDKAVGGWRDFPVPFGKNAGTALWKIV